ncbi:hypothetical protein J32TS6_33780 [Virgibacillus pantothenticus]|uniref:hypothetical protein n=1 Tax=Virgibacillus TaxID=84406 RepID=UPI0009562991|nr:MULTISPECIES: hypothetical protein [Virgibacillus]MED3736146.1 hypothetical protein [Virgibacillus pantothenticus]GIP64823.1 hypothetical protein J32TS6_33780 [Virgibacillus pantothenticus]SIT00207.1 hypothetical protein SAMN05421787_109155 [Virgibacillus pantothenticus]
MSKLDNFFYSFLGIESNNLAGITLHHLEQKMKDEKFPEKLIEEILLEFNQIINQQGEKGFQKWLTNLHYQVPDPFSSELKAANIYSNYRNWIEDEIVKLERETELTWEEQTKDIESFNIKARKAQLVLRHRISEIVLDLLN